MRMLVTPVAKAKGIRSIAATSPNVENLDQAMSLGEMALELLSKVEAVWRKILPGVDGQPLWERTKQGQ